MKQVEAMHVLCVTVCIASLRVGVSVTTMSLAVMFDAMHVLAENVNMFVLFA